MIGVGLSLPVIAGRAGDPLPGLAQGGALFDPARDERWRQVSDGTVPAGAGDPVGWGQELTAGKLLTQATTGNRPTRGRHPKTGVRNLLDASEDVTNAAWVKTGVTAANLGGGVSEITADTSNDYHVIYRTGPRNDVLNARAVDVKKPAGSSARYVTIGEAIAPTSAGNRTIFDLDTGVYTATGSNQTPVFAVQALADGWFRIGFARVSSSGATERFHIGFVPGLDSSGASAQFVGAGEKLLIRRAQLETGSTATPYQRRVTINDVTEAGVPDAWFTVYDGTSHRLEGDAAMRDIFRNCNAGFFACVVEPTALGAVDIVGFSVGDSATNVRVAFRTTSNGTLEAQVRRADGGSASVIASASGVLEVNQKRIVMVVVDWVGGTVHLYASNPITPIATGAPPSGSGPSADTRSLAAAIGSRSDGSSRYFNGRLHGPIVMGRIAPSAAQRQTIFSRLSTITGAPLS